MVTSLTLCHRFFIVFSIKNTCPSANALQNRYNRSTFCSCSTIEHFFYHIFKGIGYGSLGVAPLAGLDTKSKNPMERLLRFIYDHLNDCYGYRDLYQATKKYSTAEWVPSYYAYLPKYPTPSMLYAAIEIQNPHGIHGYIMTILKGELKRLKNLY